VEQVRQVVAEEVLVQLEQQDHNQVEEQEELVYLHLSMLQQRQELVEVVEQLKIQVLVVQEVEVLEEVVLVI
jgi:hypothetical protein